MVAPAGLLGVLCLVAQAIPSDTATFSDAQTAELFARARVRHVRQDSLVRDYQARVETRLLATAGRSRFARQTTLFAHETAARLTWREPNDLKLDVQGTRTTVPVLRLARRWTDEIDDDLEEELRAEVIFDRPWIIPRALGDSIRLMGVPERAALHPLARNAIDHYRYTITDSVRLILPGRTVDAVKIRVMPKTYGASLVAGDLWVDAGSGDVVRLMVVFVGRYLWDQPDGSTPGDSVDAREDNEWANRLLTLEADIEYALIEQRYWMPFRQILAITLELPWFTNLALPMRAITTFRDYRVNTSPDLRFAVAGDDSGKTRTRAKTPDGRPDTARGSESERRERGYYRAGTWSNGRWEMEVPPADSLLRHPWESEFAVELHGAEERRVGETIAALAGIEERLPDEWIGRRRLQVAFEQFADLMRFNRVQGVSLGWGYQFRPSIAYTTLHVRGQFGLADLRPTGSVTWRREAPAGRLEFTGFRQMREVEPWTSGLGVGNSLNAVFTTHDEADYYLSLGGGASYTWYGGLLRDVELRVAFERQFSVATEAGSAVADIWSDGATRPNPAIVQGNFVRGAVTRPGRIGPVKMRQGIDVLAGEGQSAIRGWSSLRLEFTALRRTGTLSLRGGVVRGDALPQLLGRVGGLATVRGHPYGAKLGREFWSAQLDYALRRSAMLTPVVFADVGDTFSSDPLVGVGAGVSFLNGFARLNLSKGFNPSRDVRFDLIFRAPR